MLKSNGYATGAFTGGVTLNPQIGFGQGFDTYSTDMFKMTDIEMAEMHEWIKNHEDKPFFLFWHTFEVHGPYLNGDLLEDRHSELQNDLQTLKDRLGNIGSFENHKTASVEFLNILKQHVVFNKEVFATLYAGGVRSMDHWIGDFIRFLKERNLYDQTLIILTSDHGEEFSEHNPEKFYDSYGHSAYEEMIRIPLIIKLPKQRHSGLEIKGLSRAIDVMPTILDLTGIKHDAADMQGESLVSLWEKGKSNFHFAFTEGSAFENEIKSLRSNRYKYIVEIPSEIVTEQGRSHVPQKVQSKLLFDLQTDPFEKINLFANLEQSKVMGIESFMDKGLRSHSAKRLGPVGETELDEETIKKLKALGNVQ